MNSLKTLLTRRVEKIYPSKKALEEVLHRGKKLRVYNGIDPSNPNIHLGNAVSLWKLREFQKLGHEVILLIGDFTGRIGDPSDKTAMRPKLTHQQVLENAKTYKKQAAKILDFTSKKNPPKIKFNSSWLDKLTFKEVTELAACFTVQQMIERDLFQRRLREKKPIGLHEFLYPLMQGYDSVAMEVDLEVGGRDQTFNMLAGRTLMKIYLKKEKFILTTPLLEGTDGRKMSKSWGNVVNLLDPPEEMFGKIMSLKDELIIKYFNLATNLPLKKIKKLEKKLNLGKVHPMRLKKRLAFEIVKMYAGQKSAEKAQKEFERVIQKKGLPREIPEKMVQRSPGSLVNIIDILKETGLVKSRSEGKRLVSEGAVRINDYQVPNTSYQLPVKDGIIVKVGKRKFLRIKMN